METRKEKREAARQLQETRVKLSELKKKNMEMWKFLHDDRKRTAEAIARANKAIEEANQGAVQIQWVLDAILYEIVKKYGEITIPAPTVKARKRIDVEKIEEQGLIRISIAKEPEKSAETEEKGTEESTNDAEPLVNT